MAAIERLSMERLLQVAGLVQTLEVKDPLSVRDACFRADGFCLPHLRLALGMVDDRATAKSVAEHFLKSLQSYATELGLLASPADVSPETAESWPSEMYMRAVERFSGRLGT